MCCGEESPQPSQSWVSPLIDKPLQFDGLSLLGSAPMLAENGAVIFLDYLHLQWHARDNYQLVFLKLMQKFHKPRIICQIYQISTDQS